MIAVRGTRGLFLSRPRLIVCQASRRRFSGYPEELRQALLEVKDEAAAFATADGGGGTIFLGGSGPRKGSPLQSITASASAASVELSGLNSTTIDAAVLPPIKASVRAVHKYGMY
jgi:hypothetical protein